MKDVIDWLPLLNIPVFWIVVKMYVRNEVRLTKLETHQARVEHFLGFNDERRAENHGN